MFISFFFFFALLLYECKENIFTDVLILNYNCYCKQIEDIRLAPKRNLDKIRVWLYFFIFIIVIIKVNILTSESTSGSAT